MKKTKMNYEAGKIPLPSEIGEGDFALNVPDNITYTKDRTNRVYPTSIMPTGFKNWVINGSFLWWQRGTSFSGTGYTADRWKISGGNTLAASGYASGLGNYVWFYSNGSAQWDWIGQFIELPSWYSGKTMTVSYRIRYASGYDNSDAFFWARWDTDGTPFSTKMGDDTITDVWQYVTHTFTVPTDSTNWSSFSLRWHGSDEITGRNYGFDLAQVQFELGAHATPFEMRPKAVEFPLCQRYYQAMGTLWAVDYGTNSFVQSFLPVTMRATPTIAYTLSGVTLSSNYTSNLRLALYCVGTVGSASNIQLDAEF